MIEAVAAVEVAVKDYDEVDTNNALSAALLIGKWTLLPSTCVSFCVSRLLSYTIMRIIPFFITNQLPRSAPPLFMSFQWLSRGGHRSLRPERCNAHTTEVLIYSTSSFNQKAVKCSLAIYSGGVLLLSTSGPLPPPPPTSPVVER